MAKSVGLIRIKATETKMNNVAYIYNDRDGGWRCVLANGIPAGMEYAGIHTDQMGLKFALERVATADEALILITAAGSPRYRYEII